MKIATIGLDLAKNVFQLHGVDVEGRVAIRRRLRRAEVLRFFTGLPPCLVGMEACAGAHHWARTITSLGHEVRLMPPAYVKPYVRRQKNDMADAAAICEAVTRPSMRFVPVKSEAQQALLLVHRARDLLVRQRTSLINALRAHLAEFGVVVPKGAPHGRKLALTLIEGETHGLPASAVPALQTLARQCQALSEQIAELERELRQRSLQDEATRRLLQVPGIGPAAGSRKESGMTERGETRRDGDTLVVRIPMRFQRRGGRKRIVAPDGSEIVPASPQPDGTLVKALARAWRWQRMLDDGVYATVSEIGDAENISKSYVSRILRLALLAPDIIEAILAGKADQSLILEKLERPVPASWEEQRRLAFAR